MPNLFYPPHAFIPSGSGLPQAGALAYFYITATSTLKDTFADYALTTPNANPVVADANGVWGPIYLSTDVNYRVTIKTSGGATIYTQDDIPGPITVNQSDVGLALYPRTADEITASVTPTYYYYPPGDVRRYGALLNGGATDDTAAFQAAGIASLQPYAPSGTTKITGSIPLRANQEWNLDGTVINITGTTVQVFTVAAGINDWAIVGTFSVVGDNDSAGSTTGTAAAIAITDSMRWRVIGLTAKTIKGWGIVIKPGSSTSSRAERGQIIAPQMFGCYYGIQTTAGTGAEYVAVSAPVITRCHIGISCASGNMTCTGGNVVDCYDGVIIESGANSAHGIFTGVNINHNTDFGVTCNGVTNGMTFVDCHFYQNSIWFNLSKGIVFDGGVIDAPVYNYKDGSSGLNYIQNMYCPGGYGFGRKAGANNGHDQLIIRDCGGPDILNATGDVRAGIAINSPSQLYTFVKRTNGTSQSLTSGVAATLIFPSLQVDPRLANNQSTGETTVPEAGAYQVRCSLLFVGTAMSTTASFVDVKVNGTSSRLHVPAIFSTTKLGIDFNDVLYLAANDIITIVATITGTTPVFGDSTWSCTLEVERVA